MKNNKYNLVDSVGFALKATLGAKLTLGAKPTFEKSIKGREKRFPSFSRNQKAALIDCIIDSILQEIKNHNIPDSFWTKHFKEILSERKNYKKEFEYIENKTNEIIRLLTELRDDMEKTIISEQEKYGFLAYD